MFDIYIEFQKCYYKIVFKTIKKCTSYSYLVSHTNYKIKLNDTIYGLVFRHLWCRPFCIFITCDTNFHTHF
jgi:hypothetical protein